MLRRLRQAGIGPEEDRCSSSGRRAGADIEPDWFCYDEANERIGAAEPFHLHFERGTIVAMSTESLRTVRDRFSEFVDRIEKQHERVVVTRNGTPAAVLISPEDLESLEETLAVLGDAEAVAELVEAHRAYLAGEVVRGVEAVEALRPR
jgi:antitoxin YefM